MILSYLSMKTKISITIDEATIHQIEERLKEGMFRNKSHIIEYSVQKLLRNTDEHRH